MPAVWNLYRAREALVFQFTCIIPQIVVLPSGCAWIPPLFTLRNQASFIAHVQCSSSDRSPAGVHWCPRAFPGCFCRRKKSSELECRSFAANSGADAMHNQRMHIVAAR